MERNARLYPWYTAAARFHCSAPIFYLFFAEYLSLERLLQLESVYYVAYVLLEVPSGYFSDRVGRRATLVISTWAFVLGYALFVVGSGFWSFAAAQTLLAVGWTFRSGTDTSLHFDSLQAVGRVDEYAAREAIAGRNALSSAAVAAVIGGAVGTFELRGAYVVSLVLTFVPVWIVLAMREPPVRSSEEVHDFGRQVAACASYVRGQSPLRWLLGFFVAMYVLQHVPYMFYQPYLVSLLHDHAGTPLAAGVHTGITLWLASLGAAQSVRLRDRVGVGAALLLAMAVQTGLIGFMSLAVHPLVAVLILARSASPAMAEVLMVAEVTPRIPRAQRATYLSLQALCGRLAFSALLLGLSFVAGDVGASDPVAVRQMLIFSTGFGLLALLLLGAARGAPARR